MPGQTMAANDSVVTKTRTRRKQRTRVLCVDDEPSVLSGLKLVLPPMFDVLTAPNGVSALKTLEHYPDIGVVISDMQMPGMDGATLLAEIRNRHPACVRMLLTGAADIETAARAVNEGKIFMFLRKPCPTEDLVAATASAVRMHNLLRSEAVLLEETLLGSVTAVVKTLGLTSPIALGRAVRVQEMVRRTARDMELEDRWQLEFAALLSQVATAVVQEKTQKKHFDGDPMNDAERQELVDAMDAANRILESIPRLESVTKLLMELREITAAYGTDSLAIMKCSPNSRLLHSLIELDRSTSTGRSVQLDTTTQLMDDPRITTILEQLSHDLSAVEEVWCATSQLAPGMIIADDLNTDDGLMLLPRGFELSPAALAHIVDRFRDRLPERVKIRAGDASHQH